MSFKTRKNIGVTRILREDAATQISTKPKVFDVVLSEIAASNVDRETGIIKDVVYLSETSKYKSGKVRRIYPPDIQKDAIPLFEGLDVYFDHLDKRGGKRSGRELVGCLRNCRFAEGENKSRADFHVLKDEEKVFNLAEQMPEKISFSIFGEGSVTKKGGIETVRKIIEADSADLVTRGATTKGLFESMEDQDEPDPTKTLEEEEEEMDWSKITLAEIRAKAPHLEEEWKKQNADSAKQVKLEEENKSLKTANDEFKVKEKLAEREKEIDKKIKDSKIDENLVSEVFRETLTKEKDDKKVDALIEDRKTLKSSASPKRKKVVSSGRTELTEERVASGASIDNLVTIFKE